jgi:hypothetical protein
MCHLICTVHSYATTIPTGVELTPCMTQTLRRLTIENELGNVGGTRGAICAWELLVGSKHAGALQLIIDVSVTPAGHTL